MLILQIVGARPQFVKLGPVSRAIARRRAAGAIVDELILHTGQHYDAGLSGVFFDELGIPPPAINLGAGSGSHASQTARMLEGIEQALLQHRPDVVVVYGDTNSTLAGTLAATKLGIRVAHVEAGLRSFNRRMPEELNRLATDHLSDLLLAPTRVAMAHLANEGLAARSRWVGDVMHDALLFNLERARRQSGVLQRLGLEAGRYSVATVHRAENTAPDALRRILTALATVAHGSHRIILPLHPRTRAVLGSHPGTDPGSPAVCHVDPLPYLDMLCLVESAGLVLTDSGGLQKEAFMLGTPCVTFRTETEWTETVAAGANVVAGREPEAIVAAARGFLAAGAGAASRQRLREAAAAEYGPGDAAARIVDVLLKATLPA